MSQIIIDNNNAFVLWLYDDHSTKGGSRGRASWHLSDAIATDRPEPSDTRGSHNEAGKVYGKTFEHKHISNGHQIKDLQGLEEQGVPLEQLCTVEVLRQHHQA